MSSVAVGSADPLIAVAVPPGAAPLVVCRARPLHRHRRRARWTAATLGLALVVLAAACGSSKSTTTASGASSTTAKGASGRAALSAYASCLSKNGVKLPAGFGVGGFRGGARPTTGGTAPTGSVPTGSAPSGSVPARGAGGAGAAFRNDPAFQKAQKACAGLRPKGSFGGGGAGSTAFQAFVSCMSSHGITVRGRGGFGPGGSGSSTSSTASTVPATTVDTSSAQYQAAYAVCKALLPTAPGSTTTTA